LDRRLLALRPGHWCGDEPDRARRTGSLLMESRLRVLRAERSWSQQDLAERLEVSRQSVNAIETGKYDPSLPLAFRIAELFELPIEEIFVSPSRRSSKAI
jgi:putative transcriptional regulator